MIGTFATPKGFSFGRARAVIALLGQSMISISKHDYELGNQFDDGEENGYDYVVCFEDLNDEDDCVEEETGSSDSRNTE